MDRRPHRRPSSTGVVDPVALRNLLDGRGGPAKTWGSCAGAIAGPGST